MSWKPASKFDRSDLEQAIRLIYPIVRNKGALSKIRLPNLIGIGSSRSGTSSLFGFLSSSPDVYTAPMKETNFFAVSDRESGAGPMTLRDYRLLFAAQSQERYICEITPVYISVPGALESIRRHCGDIRLIVNLRDPYDRMISHFKYHKPYHECDNFAEYVRRAVHSHRTAPDGRVAWKAPRQGILHSLYSPGLATALSLFSHENILILYYDDVREPDLWANTLSEYLDIEISAPQGERFRNRSERESVNEPDLNDLKFLHDVFSSDLEKLRSFGLRTPESWLEKLVAEISSRIA